VAGVGVAALHLLGEAGVGRSCLPANRQVRDRSVFVVHGFAL
jgi:hypothetical protein